MKQRGRTGKGSLAMVTPIGERKALEPPVTLTEAQQGTWREVVACYPAEYFNAALVPLLASYCRHVDYAATIDRELAGFKREWLREDEGLKRYKALSAMRMEQTSSILSLARSLRLTNQSRYTPQRAAMAAVKGGTAKPWE